MSWLGVVAGAGESGHDLADRDGNVEGGGEALAVQVVIVIAFVEHALNAWYLRTLSFRLETPSLKARNSF